MRRFGTLVITVLLGLFLVSPSFAFAEFNLKFPPPVGHVNDFAHFLKPETVVSLEQELQQFEQTTQHEIVVVTTDSLQGTTPEDLRVRWFKEWGIGKAGADNGLLILIIPPEHVVTTEIGYGLEGAVPDSVSQQVGDTIMVPKIRDGDPDGAVVAGVEAFMKLTQGEEVRLLAGSNPNANTNAQIGLVFFAIMLMLIGWGIYDRIAMVQKIQKTLRGQSARGILVTALSLLGGVIAGMADYLNPFIWAVIFGGTVGLLIFRQTKNAGTPPRYGGGSSGGFWSGGGSSGGGSSFGGFGGGSSGGGGSTSRW